MNFIQGEKFLQLSDNNRFFYRHTHEVVSFLKNPPIVEDFVLITHNSDHKITKDLIDLAPKNMKKWYGQNVCVEDKRLESLPIGLENSEWFPEINKLKKIENKRINPENKNRLLYINHNINTNPKERLSPYKIFGNSEYVTLFYGKNGNNFDEYLNNISSHKFVLCPEGNGTDTHRTWECLYLGTIPIEKKNINNSFYQDLPICFVDDWSDINEEFLNQEYERICRKDFNLSKLNFDYWKERILEN
jgi:hypothetical protein